jgi:enoyl-CoA hydratase/carnithine racemase
MTWLLARFVGLARARQLLLLGRELSTTSSMSLGDQLRNEAFALELSSRSEDFREGLVAFREERDPRFSGR